VLALALASLHAVVAAGGSGGAGAAVASGGFTERLISTVFDPAWNVEHRVLIGLFIVVVLFVSGVGLPLPEDIPLTLAGFTVIKQAGDVFIFSHYAVTFLVVVVPILGGDMIAYSLGRRYGLGLTERFHLLRRALTQARLARVQHWFDRYGAFAVFLGRQVAGVRFVTFFTAGSMRVPFPRFVFFDFLGCLVSVPVWLTLGTLASRYGEPWLRVAMHRVGNGILLIALALIILLVVVSRLRAARANASASAAPAVKDRNHA
jgi:membrane protein DedA with SNARE-associated domain